MYLTYGGYCVLSFRTFALYSHFYAEDPPITLMQLAPRKANRGARAYARRSQSANIGSATPQRRGPTRWARPRSSSVRSARVTPEGATWSPAYGWPLSTRLWATARTGR